MKRLFVLLLALVLLLSLVLAGCGKEEKQEKVEENVTDRYYLYISENKLHCLDAKTGEKKEIETGMAVYKLSNALVSESNGHMLMELVTEQDEEGLAETTALFLWDGKSADATLVDTDAALARVNKTMDTVVYAKEQTLYEYRVGKGSEKILEFYYRMSVAEDLSGVLALGLSKENLESAMSETGTVQEWDLIYKETGKEALTIARISADASNPSATSDHSIVCYTKGPSDTPSFKAYPAYMWTPKGGEVELPFKATQLRVHSKNEIYYIGGQEVDGLSLYCYDGKESHLLYTGVSSHIHKLSNQLSYAQISGEEAGLALGNGKALRIPGRLCPSRNILGGISCDGKTMYTWDEDTWYKTQLQENGELSVSTWFQGREYVPKYCQFVGDQLAYEQDDTLYCNGQKVADGFDSGWTLGTDGRLHYTKDGVLYCYENGQSSKIADVGPNVEGVSFENNVVMMDGDNVYILKGSEKYLVVQAAQSVLPVRAWGAPLFGNVYIGGAKIGWWYENTTYEHFGIC